MGNKLDSSTTNAISTRLVRSLGPRVSVAPIIVYDTVDLLNARGGLVEMGNEVDAGYLQKGDRYRVEYSLLRPRNMLALPVQGAEERQTKYWMTAEAVYDGHGVMPYHYSHEQIKDMRVFLLYRPETKLDVPESPGVQFTAKTGDGPVEWAFITRADGAILCVDEKDMNGQTWTRRDFSNKFTVTEVL